MGLMDKSEYSLMYRSEEKLWWYKSLREIINFYIKKHASKKNKILDAGCGTGMNIFFLRSKGYDVKGIDLSPDAIAFCKRRGLKNVTLGNITKTPYTSGSFNVIISLDVLGHLDASSRKKTINEFYRLLKPNGFIIMQCAAFEVLRSQHDKVVHLENRFTRSELKKMLSPKNWRIVKVSYRFFLLFFLIATIKFLKKISSRHKAKGDVYLPNKLVNSALFAVQKIEDKLLPYISYPLGISIFMIAQKVSVKKNS